MPVGLNASLSELLGRMRSASGRSIELSTAELLTWPAGDVAALQAAGAILRGSPGNSTVCPGCEQACVMPVEEMRRSGRPAVLFIVCDKREDVASVPVAPALLERWRTNEAGLADSLARLLGAGAASPTDGPTASHRLGVIKGRLNKEVAYLGSGDGGLKLMLAGHALDLLLVLNIENGVLALDTERLRRCVDSPAGTSTFKEQPEDRQKRLQELVATERQRNPRKFLQAVADRESMSVFALKLVIYRKSKVKTADPMADMARRLVNPVSKKARRKA